MKWGAPIISHVFFGDDSVLFFKATTDEASTVKAVLHEYELASGTTVNYSKSMIYFSPNTTAAARESICFTLQVTEHKNLGSYLGLPTAIGRNKKDVFRFF